jgi:hypothetical protein
MVTPDYEQITQGGDIERACIFFRHHNFQAARVDTHFLGGVSFSLWLLMMDAIERVSAHAH